MPDRTPLRGYNRPDAGAADWHIPLNENFTLIEDDVKAAPHEAAIQVFGEGLAEAFFLSDFADIGEAIQAAHDELIATSGNRGGAVRLPVGHFDYATPMTFNVPISIIAQGGSDWRRLSPGQLGVNTRLNWVGGSGPAVTVRASSDSLLGNPGHVPGVHLEGFLMTNEGGSVASHVFLDGTSNTFSNGSLIPKFTMDRMTFAGAAGPEVEARGTVFQGAFQNVTVLTSAGRGMVFKPDAGQVAGGPSQLYFFNPFFQSDGAGHAADLESQQVGIFGGTVNNQNGGQGLKLGYRGAVWATNFEGTGGARGATLYGAGPWHFFPATCSRWETGLSIGDPDTPGAGAADIRFAFDSINNTQDVLVQSGGQRNGWRPEVPGLTIVDERRSQDGIQEIDRVELDNHLHREAIPVDGGDQSFTIDAHAQGGYDGYDYSIVTADAADFALGEPIVTDLSDARNIPVTVPVVRSSATAGATATMQFEFKRYTG